MTTVSIKLDSNLIDLATATGLALNRTRSDQIEHWARIGQVMEGNPDLTYTFVKSAQVSTSEFDTGQFELYDFG
jgi:hypothetical protein